MKDGGSENVKESGGFAPKPTKPKKRLRQPHGEGVRGGGKWGVLGGDGGQVHAKAQAWRRRWRWSPSARRHLER